MVPGVPEALVLPVVLDVIGVLDTRTGYHFCTMPSRYIKEYIVLKSVKSLSLKLLFCFRLVWRYIAAN